MCETPKTSRRFRVLVTLLFHRSITYVAAINIVARTATRDDGIFVAILSLRSNCTLVCSSSLLHCLRNASGTQTSLKRARVRCCRFCLLVAALRLVFGTCFHNVLFYFLLIGKGPSQRRHSTLDGAARRKHAGVRRPSRSKATNGPSNTLSCFWKQLPNLSLREFPRGCSYSRLVCTTERSFVLVSPMLRRLLRFFCPQLRTRLSLQLDSCVWQSGVLSLLAPSYAL